MTYQFSSVQLLSHVWLFVTPSTAAHQASLSITNSWCLLNSCPSSQWYHPAISSSVVPFSSCPQSLPASGSFPMSQLFAWGVQKIPYFWILKSETKATIAKMIACNTSYKAQQKLVQTHMFREKSTKCFNSNSTGTIVFQQDCLLFQSVLAPAVIAKFYRLGGLENRNLFNLLFWRLGNPRRRCQHGLFLVRAPFWLVDNCLLTISTYVVGKEREHMSSLASFLQFSSVHFRCSVVSDCLGLHGLQHARPPCPSPTPGAYSNSCPSSPWYHPAFSFSVIPFSSHLKSPRIMVFSNESVLHIRWPKYWSFSFNISSSNDYSGLISFWMVWLNLLAVQGTLKSLLQHHSSKASILLCSAFFIVQLSHLYMTTGKTIALTKRTFVGKVMSLLLNMLFLHVC